MPRYKTRTSTGESEYESDEETVYLPIKPLGKGYYAQARLFKSDSEKAVVVLNPVTIPGDIGEAKIKHRFFQTCYPDKKSHLFMIDQDYRLVVPYISSVPYKEIKIDTAEFQKIIFLSAIQALKECHDKGIIVIDLKSDNIYYDSTTQKSHLVDGGLSALTGEPIDSEAFQKSNENTMAFHRKKYRHIPPECWTVAPASARATPEMDVYSVGRLMHDLLVHPAPEIQSLIDSCLEEASNARPSLEALRVSLESSKLIALPGVI